mgnify:CR=1 FL=1
MKYVHSLWSKPATTNNFDNNYDVKYITKNFYTYLLSLLLVKRLGYSMELYCDELTFEYYNKLPYDKFNIVDFDSDGISSKFWIWGKIKTHLMMNEPYIHIDGDVLLFKDVIGNKFDNTYSVIVQSVEDDKTIPNSFNDLYRNGYKPFENIYINYGKYDYVAYNCGVVGFNDIKFKNEYANNVKNVLYYLSNNSDFDHNRQKYNGMFLIAEQSLLYYMTKEKNIKVFEIIPYELIKNNNYSFDYWYSDLPKQIGYCHLLGYSKYKLSNINKIKLIIKNNFPEYYSIVTDFEKKYNVNLN